MNQSRFGLESLLYSDVPEPAFDRGQRLVVAILEAAGHEWWILIEHVLHSKRDCGVVKPPFPVAAAVLGRGYWHDIFLLAVLRPHVFTAILGEARHFRRRRWRQVQRV